MEIRRPRPQPEGTFTEHGESPASPPPFRPDQPSPYELLHPAERGVLVPPPRPDRVPVAVATNVRRYVRRPVGRQMFELFGVLVAGIVVGLLVSIGQSAEAIRRDPLFSGLGPVNLTVVGVFLHNVLLVVVPVVVFPLLFWRPAVSVGVTGYTVGRLAALWSGLHLPFGALVLGLVPHGVIEIPSFLLAGVILWRIGIASWGRGRFGGSWWLRVRSAFAAAWPFLLGIVAALAVAATIEVKVTPALVRSIYPNL